MVFFIKSPLLLLVPVITIDPVTDRNVDDNNYLVLTGKTNLPDDSHIFTYVYPLNGFLSGCNKSEERKARGDVWLTGGTIEWNFWKGTINISSLEPGEYQVIFRTMKFTNNFTEMIESDPITSFQFTLGDDNCTGECIRKKDPVKESFIRINPVPEGMGDPEVTGITSLAPGTPLVWRMDEKTGTAVTSPAVYQGKVKVIPGTEGVNRWSFLPDKDTIHPGLYQVTVAADTGENLQINGSGRVSGSLVFNYTGEKIPVVIREENRTGSGNNAPVLITIDTLPEMRVDDKYIVSGTTNLPPGEELCFEVHPPDLMLNYNFTINPRDKSQGGTISGIAGCVPVVNGSGIENLWTFEMQTYSLAPGRYEVNISNIRTDPVSSQLIPGVFTNSEEFTVHG